MDIPTDLEIIMWIAVVLMVCLTILDMREEIRTTRQEHWEKARKVRQEGYTIYDFKNEK